MNRRSYLAALSAGLSAFAGCASLAERSPTETVTTIPEDQTDVRIETVTMNLEIPWGAAFHPETSELFVTERPGRVAKVPRGEERLVNGEFEPVADFTDVIEHTGEGGLLGLAFDPNDSSVAYTYQTYGVSDGVANRVVEHDAENDFAIESVLIEDIPASSRHNGGRLAVGPDDALYVTTGDAGDEQKAGDEESLAGKVLRLTLDGSPHPDNPFDDEVFTYGHRNPQGLTFQPGTDALYSTEHGPDHDDEINVLEAGNDYGWPSVMGESDDDDLSDPIATYTPTIAPASAAFYEGPISDWDGDLFFGTLAGSHLRRVTLDSDGGVADQTVLLPDTYGRLRTALLGPDENLYLTTSNQDGRGVPAPQDDRVLRIRPA